MQNTREKLIEILRVPIYPHLDADPAEVVADYLLDNGVTIATDNNAGDKSSPTNADRIRAMSDEELAKEFADCAIGLYCDTRKKWLPELPESVKREVFDSLLEWLQQTAEAYNG